MAHLAGILICPIHLIHIHEISSYFTYRLADANLPNSKFIFCRTCKTQHFCRMLPQWIPILYLRWRKFVGIFRNNRLLSTTACCVTSEVLIQISSRYSIPSLKFNLKILIFLFFRKLIIILSRILQMICLVLFKTENIINARTRIQVTIKLWIQIPLWNLTLSYQVKGFCI